MKNKPIFLLILALTLLAACTRAEEPQESAENKAPDFSLASLGKEEVILSEILKEKMVVLDFWASWCPYCVKVIPDLERFYQENKDRVEILGINVGEEREKVEEFVRQREISYTIALDPQRTVAKLYNVRGIPTLVAIDKEGKILYYGHSIEEMKNKIKF